jgi:hypothetical protein
MAHNPSMKEIWILGGGAFGQKAATRLGKKFPDYRIIVVDHDKDKVDYLSCKVNAAICMDAIDYLDQNLNPFNLPAWIVPVIPVHVAFHWVQRILAPSFVIAPVDLPAPFLTNLPNPMKGAGNLVYVSIADFICPDNCPEPEHICTHTCEPRPYNLYDRIEAKCPDGFKPVVIRSHQLTPSVGGIMPKALFDSVEKIKSAQTPIIMATVCRCHGVLSAFRLIH